MNKHKNSVVFSVFAVISVASLNSSADSFQYQGADVSAMKTTIDQGKKLQSMVYLGHYGYREEARPNGVDRIVYLTSFDKHKTWMLIPGKKIYTEIESMSGGPASGFSKNTVFDQRPCEKFDRSLKTNSKQGPFRRYEEWQCKSAGTNSSVFQWYDPQTGMVVRERTQDGGDISISAIKFEKLQASLFQIPPDYKKGRIQDILDAM